MTFVPLRPQLIAAAEKVKVLYAPGWKMFTYQAAMCLRKILDIETNINLFSQIAQEDFKGNWS